MGIKSFGSIVPRALAVRLIGVDGAWLRALAGLFCRDFLKSLSNIQCQPDSLYLTNK
jgi:hypothetical protein